MEIKTGLCGMRNNPSLSSLHRSGEVWSFKMTLNKLFCSSVRLKFRSICPKATFQGFVVLFKPEFMSNTECVCWQMTLGHEIGAGAACLKCKDKCEGFELHFWRFVRNNSKLVNGFVCLTCTTKRFCKSI